MPKIAFLFIARNRLPLDVVWDSFFKGHENRFSVYVHSRPGFLFNKATMRSVYFLNRQLNDSIQVDWGQATMIVAERILLKRALEDPFNERFVIVSDSYLISLQCIPLYNFTYMYDYIISASNNFVDSFADTKEGRYNPKMDPVIPIQNCREGSLRKHAEIVVNDTTVFPMFQLHCKKEGLEQEITRRSVTYSSGDLSSIKHHERRGWHPVTYKYSDATPMLIQSIKDIDNIYYETEYRREWCTSKGEPLVCFLFARKFSKTAALRLLNMSVLGASEGVGTNS